MRFISTPIQPQIFRSRPRVNNTSWLLRKKVRRRKKSENGHSKMGQPKMGVRTCSHSRSYTVFHERPCELATLHRCSCLPQFTPFVNMQQSFLVRIQASSPEDLFCSPAISVWSDGLDMGQRQTTKNSACLSCRRMVQVSMQRFNAVCTYTVPLCNVSVWT